MPVETVIAGRWRRSASVALYRRLRALPLRQPPSKDTSVLTFARDVSDDADGTGRRSR